MRTVTIERQIAKYSELTEAQKLKVLDILHDINTNYDWFEFQIEDAKNLLGILGFENVKIQFSGFSSQGDGASFTGSFKVPVTSKELENRVKALRDFAPHENIFDFESLKFNDEEREEKNLEVYRLPSRYSHSRYVTVCHVGLLEFIRSYSDMIYKRLEKEYEYLTTRAAIEETIEANDYEFYTDTCAIA